MPDGGTLLLFAAAALSVNFTPGPDMLYVIARSVGEGRRAGIVSALGLSIGYLVYTAVAASGLAALLMSFPAAYEVIRFAGAAYLIYLGLKTWRESPGLDVPQTVAHGGMVTRSWAAIFRQGALTSTLNPSIAVFFMAFLPQFIDPTRETVVIQIVTLGLVFNLTATTTHTAIALLTGTAGNWFREQRGTVRWQRRLSGAVLILLGLRVLLQI
ncbi:MAG: LysE family translocator [Anaerolineae bacterium]